jgi:hypothetical protein
MNFMSFVLIMSCKEIFGNFNKIVRHYVCSLFAASGAHLANIAVICSL